MSTSRTISLALPLLLALAAPAVMAQDAPYTEGATVEGITEYTLANGLKVLLFPDPSKQTTTVNVTYFVGSRHEAYGETGMAHLLEHLVFKGTPKHPNIPQELTEHGARPNGTTWYDRTNYFETFPATDENLEWAMDLEADRMVNSFISAEDLESEMTVVRNEFELGENDPFGVLMERTMSTAFLWHNYGKSTIGARADLENVPIERLQAFYRKYYQPDNALLVVAGKFDPDLALELAVEKFGAIPQPDRTGDMKIWETYTRDPVQDGERSVTLRRVGDTKLAMTLYKIPAGSDPSFAAVDVLSEVLGTAPSGRLHQALVKPGLAADIGSFAFQLREPGMLLSFARVRDEDELEPAVEALVATVEKVADSVPTAEEVERAKTAILKNIELGFTQSDRIGRQLSEWASMGDWRLIFLHRDRVREVTPEQVAEVAARYLKPANRTLGRFIPTPQPDRAEIPELLAIAPMVDGYVGDTALAIGEEFDPSVANVESRTNRITLDNGFRIALLPKKTRGASVEVSGAIHFGTEEALMNRSTAAGLAGSMLMRGTETMSRQEIKDEFDRLKAQVAVTGGPTSSSFRITTTRENLPAVLRLVGEVMQTPAFDEQEFQELKDQRLASLESQKAEPIPQAILALNRHLDPRPQGHPDYTMTMNESIEAVASASLDDVASFYRGFYGVGAGEVAVVGDFDPEEVRQILAATFGGWQSPQPYRRIADRYTDAEPINQAIETPDKANAVLLIGMNMPIGDDHVDYPAIVLANYMLGGGFLNSRLATRIRQEEGLSYGVGSQFAADPQDSTARFMGFAIYAPENLEPLEQAFQEELRKALEQGFTAEEVAAAKQGYLESRNVSRAQDGELAGALRNSLFLDRTLEFDARVEAAIAELTPDGIVQALRRHLDPSKLSIVKAGDFAGASEPAEATP